MTVDATARMTNADRNRNASDAIKRSHIGEDATIKRAIACAPVNSPQASHALAKVAGIHNTSAMTNASRAI